MKVLLGAELPIIKKCLVIRHQISIPKESISSVSVCQEWHHPLILQWTFFVLKQWQIVEPPNSSRRLAANTSSPVL